MTIQKRTTYCGQSDYVQEIRDTLLRTLPAFGIQENTDSFKSVKHTDDCKALRAQGEEHAARFAQYLTDNPDKVGRGHILDEILKAMAYNSSTADPVAPSYALGFLSFIEKLVFYAAEHIDVYTYAQQLKDDGHTGMPRANPTCMCD